MASVSIRTAEQQPVGMPVIIEVEIRNTGVKPLPWYCRKGRRLPDAHYFKVETRHENDAVWTAVQATNGESGGVSGSEQNLGAGKSLRVPLAVPVRPQSVATNRDSMVYMDTIHVRVTCGLIPAPNLAEAKIALFHDTGLRETRHHQMIHGITEPESSFWTHVARCYADATVLNAAFLLAGTDNSLVVDCACHVLADQPSLPEERGVELASLVRHWAKMDDLHGSLVGAALATQSEIARQTVLSLLAESKSKTSRSRISHALQLSPGNAEWLRRARSKLIEVEKTDLQDLVLAHEMRLAVEWIDNRLKKIER